MLFSKFSFIFPGLLSGGAGCSGRARAPGTAAGAESGAGGGKEAGAGEGKRQGQGIGLKKLLEELEEGLEAGQEKEAEGYYYEQYKFVSCHFLVKDQRRGGGG